MASADLYTPTLAFLTGDSGDIRTSVNADVGSTLLAAGSVNAQRDRRGYPREGKIPDLSIEIVRGPATPERPDGIGYVQTDVVFDLYCTNRRNDTAMAQTQVSVLDKLTRAIRRRYQGVSNLAITATGATFLFAAAEIREHDVDSSIQVPARAIVRATFTFGEALAANT